MTASVVYTLAEMHNSIYKDLVGLSPLVTMEVVMLLESKGFGIPKEREKKFFGT